MNEWSTRYVRCHTKKPPAWWFKMKQQQHDFPLESSIFWKTSEKLSWFYEKKNLLKFFKVRHLKKDFIALSLQIISSIPTRIICRCSSKRFGGPEKKFISLKTSNIFFQTCPFASSENRSEALNVLENAPRLENATARRRLWKVVPIFLIIHLKINNEQKMPLFSSNISKKCLGWPEIPWQKPHCW